MYSVVAAIGVGIGAFALRFLTFRGLPNDHYMHLVWAQQVVGGAIPGRDFWEPGMPLAVLLSALVQGQWPGPFSEGLLSIIALAIAAAVTTYVVSEATRSTVAGLLAGLLQVAFFARLYSYPKILIPAVALLLLLRYAKRPSTGSLFLLAAWMAVGFLFRHDLGVIAAIAVLCGLIARPVRLSEKLSTATMYVAYGLCVVLPYLLFVAWNEGLGEHVRVGIEFGRADAHQFLLHDLPRLPPMLSIVTGGLDQAQAAALLFWLTHVCLLALIALAVVKRRDPVAGPLFVACAVLMLGYRVWILRHPLAGRVSDAAAVIACAVGLVGAALVTLGSGPRTPVFRAVGLSVATLLLVLHIDAAWTLTGLGDELDESGALLGWRQVRQQADHVVAAGRSREWDTYWPAGEVPPVVTYLRRCTVADERVLMTWPAPEYYFFARRPFAAGHALLLPGSFSSDQDQQRIITRLHGESVPVVLINDSRLAEFTRSFPLVADYIHGRYVPHGQFTIRDGSAITIAIRHDLTWAATYGPDRWPCSFRQAPPARDRAPLVRQPRREQDGLHHARRVGDPSTGDIEGRAVID